MRTQAPVAAFGQAGVAMVEVSSVAVWPTLVLVIGPAVAKTVLLAGVVPFSVKTSAVAVAAPPANKTLPGATTVAVSKRRRAVSGLMPLTGAVADVTVLSHRSQLVKPVVFAQLSPPAISTCVAL